MVEQIKSEGEGPRDKYRMVYIIFYWLGIGTLLPWNMFISVSNFDSSGVKCFYVRGKVIPTMLQGKQGI